MANLNTALRPNILHARHLKRNHADTIKLNSLIVVTVIDFVSKILQDMKYLLIVVYCFFFLSNLLSLHVYSPIAHTFSLKICVKIVLKNLFFSQLCILEENFEDDSDKGRYQVSVRPAIKTMCHQNYVSFFGISFDQWALL